MGGTVRTLQPNNAAFPPAGYNPMSSAAMGYGLDPARLTAQNRAALAASYAWVQSNAQHATGLQMLPQMAAQLRGFGGYGAQPSAHGGYGGYGGYGWPNPAHGSSYGAYSAPGAAAAVGYGPPAHGESAVLDFPEHLH